jgi:hypothetical protein
MLKRTPPEKARCVKAADQAYFKGGCRSALNASAAQLSVYYDFIGAPSFHANMGDVLHAVDNGCWRIRLATTTRRAWATSHPVTLKAGEGYTKVPLPEVYKPEEWAVIRNTWA